MDKKAVLFFIHSFISGHIRVLSVHHQVHLCTFYHEFQAGMK